MLSVKEIDSKLSRLRTKYAPRDQRMRDVLSVRQGDLSKVFPSMFSEDYPKPLVANFIDVAARDLAEAGAPLPSFNCSANNMVSDAQRKAADTRTRIANYYVSYSNLSLQNYKNADWFFETSRVTLEHYQTRQDFERAESRAIKSEKHKYNIAKNPDKEQAITELARLQAVRELQNAAN